MGIRRRALWGRGGAAEESGAALPSFAPPLHHVSHSCTWVDLCEVCACARAYACVRARACVRVPASRRARASISLPPPPHTRPRLPSPPHAPCCKPNKLRNRFRQARPRRLFAACRSTRLPHRPAPPPRLCSLAASRPRPPPRPTLTAPPEPTRHGKPRGGGADASSRPRHRRLARHPPPQPRPAPPPEPCGSDKVDISAILLRREQKDRTACAGPQRHASLFPRRPSRLPPYRAREPGPARAAAEADKLGGRASETTTSYPHKHPFENIHTNKQRNKQTKSLPPLSRVCPRRPSPRPSSLPSPAAAAPSRLRHPRAPGSFSFHPAIWHSQPPTLKWSLPLQQPPLQVASSILSSLLVLSPSHHQPPAVSHTEKPKHPASQAVHAISARLSHGEASPYSTAQPNRRGPGQRIFSLHRLTPAPTQPPPSPPRPTPPCPPQPGTTRPPLPAAAPCART